MDFDLLDVKNLADTFDHGLQTGDPFLDDRYQQQIDTFGDAKPYYRLFYRLSEMLRPRMVVELGAWQCTGAASWAPHAGTVATIDHHSDPGDDVNRERCLEVAQQYANLYYIQGWTWDVVQEVYDYGKWIDVLFIDSWHVYDKAMRDWEAYQPMLRPTGALVICDDLAEDGHSTCLDGMWRFWDEISASRERFVMADIAPYPMGFFRYES